MKKPPVRNVRMKTGRLSPLRRLERLMLGNVGLHLAARNAALGALTAALWPRFVAPYRWQLTHHTLRLAGDRALSGYRILHLTDLHAGKTRQSYLLRVIARCLAEKPDIVVITGDLIDYEREALPAIREVLAKLSAAQVPDGVLAIFGNHDYLEHSWRHVGPRSARRTIHRRLVDIVQQSGVTLLRNESVRISRPTSTGQRAELVFVGLDELWTSLADPVKAFAGIRPEEAVICLQHNPDGIDMLRNYPWQFMLCGHSHGGQAIFPLLGALYVPMEHRELLQGIFHFPPLPGQPAALHRRTMFVSRGLGHSTPIRVWCPPEATVFTVEAAGL